MHFSFILPAVYVAVDRKAACTVEYKLTKNHSCLLRILVPCVYFVVRLSHKSRLLCVGVEGGRQARRMTTSINTNQGNNVNIPKLYLAVIAVFHQPKMYSRKHVLMHVK